MSVNDHAVPTKENSLLLCNVRTGRYFLSLNLNLQSGSVYQSSFIYKKLGSNVNMCFVHLPVSNAQSAGGLDSLAVGYYNALHCR